MVEILDTKWIKTKKDLKQIVVKFKLHKKTYSLAISKKQDIEDFIKINFQTDAKFTIILEILWNYFLFNQKEFKRVQKYNSEINKIQLKNMLFIFF